MSARVFVHPRCWEGPALGALAAHLDACKIDMTNIKVGPLGTHRRRELVREISQDGAVTVFERMDGSRFNWRMGTPAPEGNVA